MAATGGAGGADAAATVGAEALEAALLGALASGAASVDSAAFAAEHGVAHQDVVGVIKSLLGDDYIVAEPVEHSGFGISDEARSYLTAGSPEKQVWERVPADGTPVGKSELMAALPIAKVGSGKALQRKWIGMSSDKKGFVRLVRSLPWSCVAPIVRCAYRIGWRRVRLQA